MPFLRPRGGKGYKNTVKYELFYILDPQNMLYLQPRPSKHRKMRAFLHPRPSEHRKMHFNTHCYKHHGVFFVFFILLRGTQPKPLCGKDPDRNSTRGRWV